MRIATLVFFLSIAALPGHAQNQQQTPPVRKEYFQIFLDAPAQKVNKVTYFDDENCLIEFKLSPDGKAIYLLDYNDKGGVKAEIINMQGDVEEVIRSHCKIHSLQEL